MNSLAASLEARNYNIYKPPSTLKQYSVKVNPDVRPEKKVTWTNKKPQQPAGRPRASNIIPNTVGIATRDAKAATTPIKAFELFFTGSMMDILIKETNRAIGETRARTPDSILKSDKNPYFKDTDEMEVRGLLGLMYYRQVNTLLQIFTTSGHSTKLIY